MLFDKNVYSTLEAEDIIRKNGGEIIKEFKTNYTDLISYIDFKFNGNKFQAIYFSHIEGGGRLIFCTSR